MCWSCLDLSLYDCGAVIGKPHHPLHLSFRKSHFSSSGSADHWTTTWTVAVDHVEAFPWWISNIESVRRFAVCAWRHGIQCTEGGEIPSEASEWLSADEKQFRRTFVMFHHSQLKESLQSINFRNSIIKSSILWTFTAYQESWCTLWQIICICCPLRSRLIDSWSASRNTGRIAWLCHRGLLSLQLFQLRAAWLQYWLLDKLVEEGSRQRCPRSWLV